LPRNPSSLQPSTKRPPLITCYCCQDPHRGRLHPAPPQKGFAATRALSYSTARAFRAVGPVSAASLIAIHFQSWFSRQVSCYTLLRGFRLPWPPSCCHNKPTPFGVSMSSHFGALSGLLVESPSPVLLTHNGPRRGHAHADAGVRQARRRSSPILSLRMSRGRFAPVPPNHCFTG